MDGKIHHNIFVLITALMLVMVVLPGTVAAQNGQDEEDKEQQDDPFKNDPFFSRPISDFFRNSSDEWNDKEEVQRHVRNLSREGLDLSHGLISGPYNANPLYGMYPVLPMLRFNRVDGLYLGIHQERMQWYDEDWFLGIENVRPTGGIGYSTALGEWQYGLGLEKLFGKKPRVMIGAEYHRAVTTDDYWRVGIVETSLTSLFASYDFMDYYKVDGYGAYLGIRSKRWFEGGISYNSDDYYSLERQTTYSVFGKNSVYRPNPSIDEGRIEGLTIAASFNPRELMMNRSFTFQLSSLAELADLGSSEADYAFNRYEGTVKVFWSPEPSTHLQWRFKAGAITGNQMPVQRQYELGGIGTLRATPFKQYAGNQMLLSNFEVHFGGNSRSGDGWIDFDDYSLNLFLDSGWTTYSPELLDGTNPFAGFGMFDLKDVHNDIGVGVGSSLVRFELAWPTENLHSTPAFWIRFNPTF